MTTEPNDPAPSDLPEQELAPPQLEDREIPADVDHAESEPAPADDTEEVEHEGQTYRVPKAVKPLLMLRADYSRQTQELAEKARGLDRERETFSNEREALASSTQAERQILTEGRELIALDWQIQQLEANDFTALQQQDPNRATQLFWQLNRLKGTRERNARALQQKIADRQSQAEREAASRRDQAQAIVARDIEGWSPELQIKLATFANRELGITARELALVEDPRIVKLLHAAFVGHQAARKLKAAGASAAGPAVPPTPTRMVGSTSPANRNPDRLSTAEWMAHRRSQLRKERT